MEFLVYWITSHVEERRLAKFIIETISYIFKEEYFQHEIRILLV